MRMPLAVNYAHWLKQYGVAAERGGTAWRFDAATMGFGHRGRIADSISEPPPPPPPPKPICGMDRAAFVCVAALGALFVTGFFWALAILLAGATLYHSQGVGVWEFFPHVNFHWIGYVFFAVAALCTLTTIGVGLYALFSLRSGGTFGDGIFFILPAAVSITALWAGVITFQAGHGLVIGTRGVLGV
jgi:hypothetical protein